MSDASLQTSFWLMVIVQTIGSVDLPGSGARKMPSPRNYVAILVTWLVLQLIADISEQARRAATAVAWALVITGMVVGPFGSRFVSFLQTVAAEFSNAPVSTTPQAGASVQTSAANAQQLGGTP